jgi:hypothetical protein
MSKFKAGQQVMYLNMYTSSGPKDVYAKYLGKARGNELARIEIDYVVIDVPYDRLADAEEYWKDKNNRDTSPRYVVLGTGGTDDKGS